MMFTHLRRSIALWICPELRGDGRAKLTRADLERVRASGVIQRFAEASCADVDARHKAIQNVGNGGLPSVPVGSGQVLDVVEEHLGSHFVSGQEDDRAGDPSFGQCVKGGIGGSVVFGEDGVINHGALPSGVDAPEGMGASGMGKAKKQSGRTASSVTKRRAYRHITKEERREIIRLLSSGVSMDEVARTFGRHQGTISHIRSAVLAVVSEE